MKVTVRHVFAGALSLIGLAFVIYLGVLSGAEAPPSRATSALLVVLAGVFQLASATEFHRIGKADPSLARAAVRRLVRMADRANTARVLAERAYAGNSISEIRKAMGKMSVELSWIEEGLLEAMADWNEFHRDALRGLVNGEGNDGPN